MNEQAIKTLIQAKLASAAHGQGAAFISELFIDAFARRADLVMANGKLSAFEIKSERDTLDRLDGQLETYLRLFEQVTIVCAMRHLSGVESKAPEGVGIWALSEDGAVKVIRKAKTKKQNSHESWLSFLPVDELRLLLAQHRLQRTGDRDILVTRATAIHIKSVRQHVLDYFKNRRESRISGIIARRATHIKLPPPAAFSFESYLEGPPPLRATPRLVT